VLGDENGIGDASVHRDTPGRPRALRRPLCPGRRLRRRDGQTSSPIPPLAVGSVPGRPYGGRFYTAASEGPQDGLSVSKGL
jgi:hypothetical protein